MVRIERVLTMVGKSRVINIRVIPNDKNIVRPPPILKVKQVIFVPKIINNKPLIKAVTKITKIEVKSVVLVQNVQNKTSNIVVKKDDIV